MGYRIQLKDGPRSKWRDLKHARTFQTEEEALQVASMLDPDGYICPGTTRAVAVA